MKLFKVVTVGPKSAKNQTEITSFLVAENMSRVIEEMRTDLLDENTDVLLLAEVAPHVMVLK